MDLITRGLATGLLIWFALLATIIAGRVLRGDIDTTGFMRSSGGGNIEPERVLTVMVFPVVIGMFALDAIHADVSGPKPSLPDISENFIMLLTGGNGLYLAGKIARLK